MAWINFAINKQNIETETASAVLIKCPNKSKSKGFTFWVSKKCLRRGNHSYEVIVGLNDERPVTLKRTSDKDFRVLDEIQKTAQEVADLFAPKVEEIKEEEEA